VVSNPILYAFKLPRGGVWKTENAGHSWKPVFDDQPLQNIGAIAIQQSNPQVVSVEPEKAIRATRSIWGRTVPHPQRRTQLEKNRLDKTVCIHRVIIDPTDPNTVYVGAIGNPYAEHCRPAVF
jgi:nucleoside diphosphate kinase